MKLPNPLRPLHRRLTPHLGERGSILILAGLMAFMIIGSAGLAVDLGRMYAAKAEISRDVDAATLAAVPDIQNSTTYNAKITNYMAANDSDAVVDSISADLANSNILIKAHKPVRLYFLSLFGFNSVNVESTAKAGTGGSSPLDATMIIDDTASMSSTDLTNAKNGALDFVSTVLGNSTGAGNVLIGSTALRGCYKGPQTTAVDPNSGCTPSNYSVGLTATASTVNTTINNISTSGGSGTNVCSGLWQGYNILFNGNGIGGTAHHATANTLRFAVLLSDGGANYNGGQAFYPTSGTQVSPPIWTAAQVPGSSASPAAAGKCQVAGASHQGDSDSNTNCTDSETQLGRDLDLDAYTLAQTMKNANNKIEIYVAAFGVCTVGATPSAALCDSTKIGGVTAYLHNFTDQNLLKCIASSTSGTNDHFIFVPDSASLQPTFNQIAGRIVNRLLQ